MGTDDLLLIKTDTRSFTHVKSNQKLQMRKTIFIWNTLFFSLLQDERDKLLKELSNAKAESERIEAELEKYRECDPEVMEQMKQDAITAKDAANRWTGGWGFYVDWILIGF